MPQTLLRLGVVGDSAAGKTTLTQGLAKLIGIAEATLVCTDDYHKFSRERRRTLNLTLAYYLLTVWVHRSVNSI